MDVLAVIPAVRSQDSRPLGGRPLALHAIDQAQGARRVTRVVAVTADAGLARLIVDSGAEIVPAPAAGGGAAPLLRAAIERIGGAEAAPAPAAGGGAAPLLRAAIERIAGDESAPVFAMMLDPEYPFRTVEAIDGAIDLLYRSGADSLVAGYPLAGAVWSRDGSGRARLCAASSEQPRFIQSDVLSAVRVDAFMRTGELPTGRTVVYEISMMSALRIDSSSDWASAEILHRHSRNVRAMALLRGIELLVFDFDGVMTDNRVLVFEDGREAVLCNRGDGLGLEMLRKAGLPMAVISKEINPVVGARCRKLKISYRQGIEDKLEALSQMAADHRLELAQIAYMGNDLNDLECMRAVGLAIAPGDSHPEALRAADLVTSTSGGFGAVREVCDLLRGARAPEF